jgi:hypothetical protein
MNIVKKDAQIKPTGSEADFPGTFEVILSAPTLDRDGDTLLPDDWKTPLPDHITFDIDHGMSVATTVGSGVPEIDGETGNLIVRGTYSSLPRAQEVRTLVNEGHIRTTSVAFMSEKQNQKDGKTKTVRELLNGAFVAIPSNREAVILNSKGADLEGNASGVEAVEDAPVEGEKSVDAEATVEIKVGARNNAQDAERIQAIHDSAADLGAACSPSASKGLSVSQESEDDPATLAQAVDAALDAAVALFDTVDPLSLPVEIQQAINLVGAAAVAIDELLEVAGIPDPDDEETESETGETLSPSTGMRSIPADGLKATPVNGDGDSDAVNALALDLLKARFIN